MPTTLNSINPVLEYFDDYGSTKTIEKFNLEESDNNEFVGMLSKGDYVMVYKVQLDLDLNLVSYYLINDDDQNYREVEFYD